MLRTLGIFQEVQLYSYLARPRVRTTLHTCTQLVRGTRTFSYLVRVNRNSASDPALKARMYCRRLHKAHFSRLDYACRSVYRKLLGCPGRWTNAVTVYRCNHVPGIHTILHAGTQSFLLLYQYHNNTKHTHLNTTINAHLASAIDIGVENTQDVLELRRDNERLPKERDKREGNKGTENAAKHKTERGADEVSNASARARQGSWGPQKNTE